MDKILHIISREYRTRVRKRAFIIMTMLGPIFFGLLMIVPAWLASASQEKKVVEVLDHSFLFYYKLQGNESIGFTYSTGDLESAKERFSENLFDGLLYIPPQEEGRFNNILLYTKSNLNISDQNFIESTLNNQLIRHTLERKGIEQDLLDNLRNQLSITMLDIADEMEEVKNMKTAAIAGLFSAVLVYFFIFLYGVQVMRGVIEEKSNRIIEIIISSVKPFELMLGKILGIALVSLTQFTIWLILTISISTFVSSYFEFDRFRDESLQETLMRTQDIEQTMEMNEFVKVMDTLDLGLILASFLFYFLAGYLLYSAMLASIGSIVDSETDTQQFMLPVTIPLIFSFVMATAVIQNPHGTLAIWMSMIPFTSPIIMMVRIPFNVPWYELALSMSILVITFVLTTFLAGRIYRTGILMHGKKPSIREIGKWMFKKNI